VSALFDPEEIMKEVRAAANLSPPAKTANLLKSAEAGASDFSRLAALAAFQDLAKAFEAGKSSPQVEIAQTDNHGVRPAKLPENEPNFSRLAALAAPPDPGSPTMGISRSRMASFESATGARPRRRSSAAHRAPRGCWRG
jgi:hypothetical protein